MHVNVPKIHAVVSDYPAGRYLDSGQHSCESGLGGRGTGVDADLLARCHFYVKALEDGRNAWMVNRKFLTGHANAVHGWIGKRNRQRGGTLIFRKREDEIQLG